ncbi:hydrocephalus-inducing protein homolog [Austrofundulus limnaeus]|uniref:Hydrocephalus-inducing protein homolog n=1 Tax=Austrofundulus limnaeus TaxID=52670 RepID=A0A2I4BIL7_AUSLI|nr:PREDICTED: hydrocephalus-inducing protein homolog [Austrofundulus limnaeus]
MMQQNSSRMRAAQFQNKTPQIHIKQFTVKEDKPGKMTPAVYAQELLQSTEQRLRSTKVVRQPQVLGWPDTSRTLHHKPIFQPYPSELVFQNFSPSQTYSLPLLLLNNDKVLHHVRLELQQSEQFQVLGPEGGSSKVAPGMTAVFTVHFTPQENQDHRYRLVCVTQAERFEIPVRAIGPRAILDFPDEVLVPVCAVKCSTEKTLLVRNVGNGKAQFRLQTQRPFSVTPSSGDLDVGDIMQVTVLFQPRTVGDHQQDLLLHYHTGEDVFISLCGTCEELKVRLDTDVLQLKSTFINMSNAHIVSLTNRWDVCLHYRWTEWSSHQVEDLVSVRENHVLLQEEEEEKESNPSAIHHLPLLSRSPQETRDQDHLLPLSDGCITVEPLEGEIFPNTTARFIIVFQPEEAKLYQHTIYCDVAGRESRLPLTVQGEGLGPDLQLSCTLINLENVFIDQQTRSEVQLFNNGPIDAPFRFRSSSSRFGGCFSFSPEEGLVPPGACQAVEVLFQSPTLGRFSEDVLLTVPGQPRPPALTFRGSVIGPTFHFDVPELSFGDVAFGFPATVTCTLFNTSFVPMTFALRVFGDGSESPSVNSTDQVSDLSLKRWQGHAAPRRLVEFTISPAAGSVRSMSQETIQVTLCSNTVKTYNVVLVAKVDFVEEESYLPIKARCVVPDVTVETPVLDVQRCYLNHPRELTVKLINSSDLPACYGLLDQENEEDPPLVFESPAPRGVLLPGRSEELPVVLLVKAVGELRCSLRVAVFGRPQPLEVVLSCVGQGPVVHVSSTQLQFGRVPVLTDVIQTLQLFNQSPIPARFSTATGCKRPFWRVEPSEGEVLPESQFELKIVVHLKDTLLFQDKLEVSIRDSRTHVVSVSASGTGTIIVSDKPFGSSLDLGTHFSHNLVTYHFKLTNHGQRVHRMFWKTESLGSGRSFLPPLSSPKQKPPLSRGALVSNRKQSGLSLSSPRVELFPGDSFDMELTATSDTPKVIKERLVCQGIIGPEGCQETLMSVNVSCRFVEPVLRFSSKQLNFCRRKVEGRGLQPAYEKLVVKNVSSLPLSLELSLAEPFYLCEAQLENSSTTKKNLVLGDQREVEVWVCFDPNYYRDQLCQTVDELLKIRFLEHPHQNTVKLHAEVHHPNLHFSSTFVDFGCVLNNLETKKRNHHQQRLPAARLLPLGLSGQPRSDSPQRHKSDEEETLRDPQGSSHPRAGCRRPEQAAAEQAAAPCTRVFNIAPMLGVLQPGESAIVTFSFFSPENVSREAVADCHVEDGPTYEVKLRGQTSEISYRLEPAHLNFGLQLFYNVGEVEMIVRNTGKVGFDFSVTYPEGEEQKDEGEQGARRHMKVRPGRPVVCPAAGSIEAGHEKHLRVLYLPGVPQVFEKLLWLQVASQTPEQITLSGEGVFPRITLNLPQTPICGFPAAEERDSEEVQEAERGRENSAAPHSQWFKLSNCELSDYLLDFGIVIPEGSVSQTVTMTNNSLIPASFRTNCKHLTGTGFSAEFQQPRTLLCSQTQTFTVKFDPKEGLAPGRRSALLLIQVSGGPQVKVRLCADVIVPTITVSTERLQFDTVQCCMCQIQTVQLMNNGLVESQWRLAEEGKPVKVEGNKFPLWSRGQRIKGLKEWGSPVFKALPCRGVLNPGDRVNVHIKFSPAEERSYSRRLKLRVLHNTQPLFITAQGQGAEPQLEFCPSDLKLGPCVPLNMEAEVEVLVKNHSLFPVEFYCLEFDQEHLREEEVLRLMPGYDEKNTLLLPPRVPGQGLPSELLDHYKDLCSQLKGNELSAEGANDKSQNDSRKTEDRNVRTETNNFNVTPDDFFFRGLFRNGQRPGQQLSPVILALTRHMGLDLPPDTLSTQNHRGIYIIVHGAPQSDKSGTAAALAAHYGAALLSVDAVVTDLIQNGSSAVSLSARQLYNTAAEAYAQGQTADTTPSEPAAETQNCRRDVSRTFQETEEVSDSSELQQLDVSTLSSLLPEQMLVEILVERLQLTDCHPGVVIDGLKSLYTHSPSSTLQIILKALNNRKHIYVVNLCDTYEALKARENQQRAAEEALQKERALREESWLWEMDQDTFDSLPEDERERVTQKHSMVLRQRRELEQMSNEEKRLREDELRKNNTKAGKKDADDVSKKKILMNGKQSAMPNVLRKSSLSDSKQSLVDTKEEQNVTKAAESSQSPHKTERKKDELQRHFAEYEQIQAAVEHILQHWDRTQGLLLVPVSGEEVQPGPDDATTKRQAPGAKKSKKGTNKIVSPSLSQPAVETNTGDMETCPHLVPHIVLNVTSSFSELLSSLPPLEEVLDNSSEPPVLPPTTFSVVPFPKLREPAQLQQTCFTFLDPSALREEEEKEAEEEILTKQKVIHRTRNKKGKKAMESDRNKLDVSRSLSQPSTSELNPHEQHQHQLERKLRQRLTSWRWVLPAGGEVALKIWFYSESPGVFEQTFQFELAGCHKLYQLSCKGRSCYPSICTDHKTLFAHSKKVPQVKKGLQKSYVIKEKCFEFGPLLCCKTRDRFKMNPFPENSEKLVIQNQSVLEAEVKFSFLQDTQAATYLLDPPAMTLAPSQKQELTVWAYPTKPEQIKDSLVCNIKDNPEPISIHFSCWGVWPELELERKQLYLGRIPLNREQSCSVMMYNKTALPVSWRLQRMEDLGDEFVVPVDRGVIASNSSSPFTVHVIPRRLGVIKKTLFLEVSDEKNVLGILQTEKICFSAIKENHTS